MVTKHLSRGTPLDAVAPVNVIRHTQVCKKLQISSAKLFDICAKGLFPKPFLLIPGGRAVGWLEEDIDTWIRQRKESAQREGL